jgi:thiol-disulfide isomerase/thioredoxin
MARKKSLRKRKKGPIFFFLLLIFFAFILLQKIKEGKVAYEKIEVLYFRNDKCPLVYDTDRIIQEAKEIFNDRIEVKIINARLYPSEPEDPEDVKILRERYGVIGLPEIIINGKKFTKDFTRENLLIEICSNFIVKPGVCR